MTYQIITVSNGIALEWHYLQKEFYKSLHGHPVLTINYMDSAWVGLTTKARWVYRAIKEGLVKADYVIYTDSWDLVFAASPQEIIQRYFSFNVDLVVNTERNCFPLTYKDEFDKIQAPTDFKYLNSGFVVGKTDALLACLEAMDLPNVPADYYDAEKKCNIHFEDQTLLQEVFLKQPVTMALDYYCTLSQTLHDAKIEEFDFSEARIKNIATNSYPCVFHFNGGAKSNLELRNPILKKLNLV
jgi:hypothetical protein